MCKFLQICKNMSLRCDLPVNPSDVRYVKPAPAIGARTQAVASLPEREPRYPAPRPTCATVCQLDCGPVQLREICNLEMPEIFF